MPTRDWFHMLSEALEHKQLLEREHRSSNLSVNVSLTNITSVASFAVTVCVERNGFTIRDSHIISLDDCGTSLGNLLVVIMDRMVARLTDPNMFLGLPDTCKS